VYVSADGIYLQARLYAKPLMLCDGVVTITQSGTFTLAKLTDVDVDQPRRATRTVRPTQT
jgi:hypothetical protein